MIRAAYGLIWEEWQRTRKLCAMSLVLLAGIGGFLAGIALDLIAFPRGADAGAVASGKLVALGLVVGPGLMVLYLATLIFLARYEITRRRHEETLAVLGRRRSEASIAGGPP